MSSLSYSSNLNDFKEKEASVGSRLSDFEIVKQLGKGSYGTVYVVHSKLDKNTYVMKKMELNHLKESQQKECYREVSILRKVSHPNIIKYYSSFLENESLCIIMEYAELGDLYTLIKHYKRHQKYFDEILLWRIAYEVLNGLDYLHTNNIIHRDIKCLNLFLSKDHHVKIGDLGVSTISALGGMHCTRVGTPLYLSPELVKQIPYDYKTDIWSFGCSLYHLASLEPPFTGNNLIVLGNNIVKGRPKDLPGFYSNEIKDFIWRMLTKKAEKRPNARDAKNMIPKNIMESIYLANKNKEEIKARPFSSVGKRKTNEINNNNINNNNNNNNMKNNEVNSMINLNNNLNNDNLNNNINKKEEEKNKVNNNNNKEIISQEEKKIKKNDINNIINSNINKKNNIINNNNINKIAKISNEIIAKKENISSTINTENKINIINNIKTDEKNDSEINNILEKNIPRQNSNLNIGIKSSSSLYKALNVQKSFNFFRNNNIYKSSKDQKTFRNLFNANNKIIKNNSIKVYSSAIKEEFLNMEKKKKKEENKIGINKYKSNNNNIKDEKKLKMPTDTNIQLISINNKNIIINNINHNNYISSQKNVKKYNRQNSESKNKTEKKNNILFPDLKLKKSSSIKDTSNINKNNDEVVQNKLMNHPKRQRPFSSGGVFKQNMNKKISNGRPLTSIKSRSGNNNVMNININFFNIDMNRRFLAPEINPLHSNEIENIEKNEILKKNESKSNINLNDYKNDNEFIFQKLIKALQDINNDKKLTINDLH